MMFRIRLDPDLDHCFKHCNLILFKVLFLFSGHGQRTNRRGGGPIPHCSRQAALHSSNRQVGPWNFLIDCVKNLPGKLLFTRLIGRQEVPIGRHNFKRILIGCFTFVYCNCYSLVQLADLAPMGRRDM
jgi:hypothetical protein